MAYHPSVTGSASASGSGSSSSAGLHFLNSPFGDTTCTKVFVGGLAWETKSETLRRYFQQFGEILEAVVITDKNTGRSKGYGFVTFLDPESARRACADPNPVIDGRRANCNLASLKRPWPNPPYGMRPASPFMGGVPFPRGVFRGSSGYHQSGPYDLPQGFVYPQFGFTYGPEYAYPQNVYNPYTGQQYIQIVPGTVNPAVYPFGQTGRHLPSGHGYSIPPGYALPGHQLMPLSGPNLDGAGATPLPPFEASYPPVVAPPVPSQPFFMVSARSPQFSQVSGSDQTTG